MKASTSKPKKLAALVLSLAAFAPAGQAQLTIPFADGSDGVLNVTSNTVINLSLAGTGSWTNTSANPGKGTYDAKQWAVVFKYNSVNIATNTKVTFLNHPTHAPVVWLVKSNVTISGELSLDGQPAIEGLPGSESLVEPGPGGFRGGSASAFGIATGFGPGGRFADSGGYSDYHAYGTTNVVPLIGGSGGSGNNGGAYYSGSGGGGAILIAASGSITLDGYCHANGGTYLGFSGSGGAIRLVANQILGSGTLEAISGVNIGKIRLEANTFANSISVNPSPVGFPPANPPVIFPPTNAPTVTVLSVGGKPAPADPKANVSQATGAADMAIASADAVTIQAQTTNFPTNGTVVIYINPINTVQSILTATFVSGNSNQALWQVSTVLPYGAAAHLGHTIIQARAYSN